MFRFFSAEEGETILEEWDNIAEELVSDRLEEVWGTKRARSVGKKGSTITQGGSNATIISSDYLKTLDKSLAAYPPDLSADWSILTNFITPRTIARVVGIDSRGNARVDASMGTNFDEQELREAGQKIWGKQREEDLKRDLSEGATLREITKEEPEGGEEILEFLKVDAKRSWPEGAVGEELTKWSQDKSWYLSHVIKSQFGEAPSGQPFDFLIARRYFLLTFLLP